jgi:hypothetical protein
MVPGILIIGSLPESDAEASHWQSRVLRNDLH